MKFSFDFEVFYNNLMDLSTVIDDSMSLDELRNIVLYFDKATNECKMIGINQLITYKKTIVSPNVECDFTDCKQNYFILQLKNRGLINYLNTYRNLHRSIATKVTFIMREHGQVECMVEEQNKDTKALYTSSRLFNEIPVRNATLEKVNLTNTTNETVEIVSKDLDIYLHTLSSVLTRGTTIYSKILFGTDYVVVFNSAMTSLMPNTLDNDVFKNITISFSVVQLLHRLCGKYEKFIVAKGTYYIYIKTDDSESFVVYDDKLANYSMFVDSFKLDNTFTLDKLQMKEIIKRLRLDKDIVDIVCDFNESTIWFDNNTYNQKMSINNVVGFMEMTKMKFKIMPTVLEHVILGNESVFGDTCKVSFIDTKKDACLIYFMDDSNKWFTVIRVKALIEK